MIRNTNRWLKYRLQQHIAEWTTLIEAANLCRKEEGRIGHDFPAEGFDVKGEWGERYQLIRNSACHPSHIFSEAIEEMTKIRDDLIQLEKELAE